MAVGSELKQAWHRAVASLVSEAQHIREEVHGDGLICVLHALFRPSVVFYPGPN